MYAVLGLGVYTYTQYVICICKYIPIICVCAHEQAHVRAHVQIDVFSAPSSCVHIIIVRGH